MYHPCGEPDGGGTPSKPRAFRASERAAQAQYTVTWPYPVHGALARYCLLASATGKMRLTLMRPHFSKGPRFFLPRLALRFLPLSTGARRAGAFLPADRVGMQRPRKTADASTVFRVDDNGSGCFYVDPFRRASALLAAPSR